MNWAAQQFGPIAHEQLLDAYNDWIREHVDDGWEAFLLTFMFRQLPGPPAAQIAVMQDEIKALAMGAKVHERIRPQAVLLAGDEQDVIALAGEQRFANGRPI